MSKKLLIISGPTATGKTTLAIKLAKKYNGELISADSRQIYKGMDIGTGKDHPKDTPVHLIDIITPKQSFSVAEYKKLAIKKIEEIHSRNKLPIIVGGTGLYIDSIISNQSETYVIKPNILLRFILNQFSVSLLQKIYKLLDKKIYLSLNNSEKHNPHRLIRKIEIELFKNKINNKKSEFKKFNFLHISLTAPNETLYQKIDNRVEERIKQGIIGEIKTLLKQYKWTDPGLNTLAYKEFKEYFKLCHSRLDLVSIKRNCIQKWKYDEHFYARRQKTWFKKRADIHIYNILDTNYFQNIQEVVAKWYNKP